MTTTMLLLYLFFWQPATAPVRTQELAPSSVRYEFINVSVSPNANGVYGVGGSGGSYNVVTFGGE